MCIFSLVVVEDLRTGVNPEDRLHALISSRQVFFLKQMIAERDNLVFRMSLRDLAHCKSIEEGKVLEGLAILCICDLGSLQACLMKSGVFVYNLYISDLIFLCLYEALLIFFL